MKYCVILIFFLFPYFTFASTNILECHLSDTKYTGQFLLDNEGRSSLTLAFKNLNSKGVKQIEITCPLFIDIMTDQSRGISPCITISFVRGRCIPLTETYLKFIRDDITLYISLWNERPTARILAIRTDDLKECQISMIKLNDLKRNIRRFNDGRWGRSPSSSKATKKKVS